MKIFELNDPDIAIEDVITTIKNSCGQYLSVAKATGKFFYRGFGKSDQLYHLNLIPKRSNVDSHTIFELAIDEWLTKIGIRAKRRNSAFCIVDEEYANEFGHLYYCFPVDGFNFAYSPNIRDIYPETEHWLRYDALDDCEEMGRRDSQIWHMLADARSDLHLLDLYMHRSKALRQFYGMTFLRRYKFYQDDLAAALTAVGTDHKKYKPEIWFDGSYHLVRAETDGIGITGQDIVDRILS